MTEPTGFLEESPGVRSMTRLTAALLIAGVLVLVVAIAVVAVRGGENAAGVIAAIGAPMLGLAGGIWGALRERYTGGAQ